MTVNFSANAANANAYSVACAPQMSNDYFGSQIFGSNPFGTISNQPRFDSAPNDLASALVQQAAGANAVASAPTAQDYMYATQVANTFANQIPINPYTSFTQNDIFAQQAFPMTFGGGQAWV